MKRINNVSHTLTLLVCLPLFGLTEHAAHAQTATLRVVASFQNTNGTYPYAGLTLGADGSFYGTTLEGGAGDRTVFKVTTNGQLTSLASFDITNGAYKS